MSSVAPETDREAEAAYQAEVRGHLSRNYTAYLLHGVFGQTGFRLINAPTFLPAFVFALSGSPVAVGATRSLQSMGMLISAIIGAHLIAHRKRVLPAGFAVGIAMRLQVLGLALSALLLPEDRVLYAVWLFMALFGFFLGMQGVIFNYLMSKMIPVERRGTLVGLRNSLSGITGAAVAYLGGRYLVEHDVLGNGYGATFLAAFVLTSIGLSMLLLVREPRPPSMPHAVRFAERIAKLPALLKDDRAFAFYFYARGLGTMGRMGMPFYILYAGSTRTVSGTELGQLSLAFILAQNVTPVLWGRVADRRGFRLVFLLSLGVWMGAVGLLLVAPGSVAALTLVFVGIGIGLGGFQMAAQNLVLEFGRRADLPTRIAVANSGQELVGMLAPLLGGMIVSLASYSALFTVSIGFQALAALFVGLFVDEPRQRASGAA